MLVCLSSGGVASSYGRSNIKIASLRTQFAAFAGKEYFRNAALRSEYFYCEKSS
jgi:hypothetical protein